MTGAQSLIHPKDTLLNRRSLVTLVLAGIAATVLFDIFGQYLSPAAKGLFGPYLGAKLAPIPLANQSLGVITGLGTKFIAQNGIGEIMHYITGLLIYPAGYMLVARPVSRITPFVPWWIVGLVYGVVLFVFALYVMAHLVSGLPAFLNWTGITWVALWGHMLFGLVVAAVVWWRHER